MEFLRVYSLISALCIVSTALSMNRGSVDPRSMQEPARSTLTEREGLKDAGALYRLARAVEDFASVVTLVICQSECLLI